MPYVEPKMNIKKIDAEYRRRRAVKRPYVDVPSPKARQIGNQDLTDIPFDVPWQKIVLDQRGIALPVNENWHCPKCGKEYNTSFPPDRCFVCGFESPLYNRRFINLRR